MNAADVFLEPVHDIVALWVADFFQTMGVWMLFAVALILADLRFGILAARRRGEQIRGSRMRRRTMNKIFDYGCWLFVAYTCRHSVGVVLGVPIISVALVLYVYLNELSSVTTNYSAYKGLTKKINIWKLLAGRHNLERALEDDSAAKPNINTPETDESE